MSKLPTTVGERGKSRVRVYYARPGSAIYLGVYDERGQIGERRSLGHRDEDRAISDALLLAAALQSKKDRAERAEIARAGTVRLGWLLDQYLRSPYHATLGDRQRREKESKLRMMVGFLGAGREVVSLDEDDILGYLNARRKGLSGLPKARGKQTLYNDFSALRSMILWATRTKGAQGKRILGENPLAGITVEQEKNPEQPWIEHDEFLALRRAARALGKEYIRLFLILAEAFGRREMSIAGLLWSDIDFEAGTILWRAEEDKMETETTVAMPARVHALLACHRQRNPDDLYVFQSPRGVHPYTKSSVDKWLGELYLAAGREKLPKVGWHSLRRKWATERKHLPVPDVMRAGGWKSYDAFKRYQQADPETTRSVIESPRRSPKRRKNMQQSHATGRRTQTGAIRNPKGDK